MTFATEKEKKTHLSIKPKYIANYVFLLIKTITAQHTYLQVNITILLLKELRCHYFSG